MIYVDIIRTTAVALGPTEWGHLGSGFLPCTWSRTEVIPSKLKRYGCMISLEQLLKNSAKRYSFKNR